MKRGTPEHPKALELRERLGCAKREAVGILELLWHFAAHYAKRGDVGRWSDARIAEACDWPGEPSVLVDALVDCEWLDRDETHRLLVHDWHDHADEAVKKALQRAGLDPAEAVYRPRVPPRPSGGAPSGPSLDSVETASRPDLDAGATAVETPSSLPSPALPSQSPTQPSPAASAAEARDAQTAASDRPAAAGGLLVEPDLFPYLTALRRFHPRLGDVADVVAALLALRGELPPPATFASALWIWAHSDDWREQGGRFVPTAAKWIRERRWRKAPRDREQIEVVDPAGWRRRQEVAELLGLSLSEVA